MHDTMKIRSLAIIIAICLTASAATADDFKNASQTGTTDHNWTGFYAGAHVGGDWVNETQTFTGTNGFELQPVGTGSNTNRSGWLGGGDIGYNYQINRLVLGVDGDFSWAHSKGTNVTQSPIVAGDTITQFGKTNWLTALAARAGYASGSVLVYGKGGVAWSEQTYGGYATGTLPVAYPTFDSTRFGGLVGAGVEWAVRDNISVSAEYNYIDFGSKSYSINDTTNTVTSQYSSNPSANIIKVGVSYHF